MDTLLMIAVIVIALAIVVQAGVLVSMYLMSRRVTNNVEGLMAESRRLMAPLESVTSNLKTVSEDLTEVSKTARSQVQRIEGLVNEARETLYLQMTNVKDQVMDSVEEARMIVMRPVREWSAIMSGISAGVRTFFGRKSEIVAEEEIEIEVDIELPRDDRQYPAA
jgi:ElaB/YqjD/DUF883 family membrane-anchored ribosome-binding protein